MNSARNYRVWTFLPLALAVWLFRNTPGGAIPYVTTTMIAILFWYFHALKFAFNSFRNIVVLLFGLGLIVYAFGDRLGFFGSTAEIGGRAELELDPAMVARLQGSHKVAVEIFLDHRPRPEERYFRTGVFAQTDNGMRYVTTKTSLDTSQFPKARQWAAVHLDQKRFEKRLEKKLGEAADEIEAWWRNSFRYSLNPGILGEDHPLDVFLFDRKNGFCEHYAAALSTLLKLGGFEARVVVGYAGGTWNPILRKLTYEETDAHAWVEARVAGTKAWKQIDPTLWVSPSETHDARDFSTAWNILAVIALSTAAIVGTRFVRRDPTAFFIRTLEKLEKKYRFKTDGQTLSDRAEALISKRPDLKTPLRATISAYHAAYFQADQDSIRLFRKQLGKW